MEDEGCVKESEHGHGNIVDVICRSLSCVWELIVVSLTDSELLWKIKICKV